MGGISCGNMTWNIRNVQIVRIVNTRRHQWYIDTSSKCLVDCCPNGMSEIDHYLRTRTRVRQLADPPPDLTHCPLLRFAASLGS